MAEGEGDDRPHSGAKARGGRTSARGYRHLVDEWKSVFARYQPELNQELLRIAGRPLTDADIDAAAAVLMMNDMRAPTDLPPRLQGHLAGSAMETAVGVLLTSAVYRQTPDHVRGLITQDPAAQDVVATRHRQKGIREFRRLLEDDAYFDEQARQVGAREAVWQQFLQDNQWILGGSLSVQFLPAWNEERLEQTVVGASVRGAGKRNDALLRTAGRVHSLVFVEIKHHRTELLGTVYRPGIWAPSRELSGGVAQVQGTVQRATIDIRERLQERASDGSDIPGAFSYLLRPRSYLIIGSLEQLLGEGGGLNTDKYQSFELHRRHTQEPEIVTFDELLARAEGLLEVSDV